MNKKKLYYGSWEYRATKDKPKDASFISEYWDNGYLFTHTKDGVPAIFYQGVLYKQFKKYREGETVGKKMCRLNSESH